MLSSGVENLENCSPGITINPGQKKLFSPIKELLGVSPFLTSSCTSEQSDKKMCGIGTETNK